MMKIIMAAYEFLNKEELESINKRENIRYLPEREMIIGTDSAIEKLMNDFPALKEYEEVYDYYDLKTVFELDFDNGFAEIETGTKIEIDTHEVLSRLIEDIEEIESDILSSNEPEKTLNDWIDSVVSEVFSKMIAEQVRIFKERKSTYHFNDIYFD